MEILEIEYRSKTLKIPYEVEQPEIRNINQDYFVYGKSGQKYTFRQYYGRWDLIGGNLNESLANAIIDALIRKHEKESLGVCHYNGTRQIISIHNLEYTAQDYAYSLMVNNTDLGTIKWSKCYGWDFDLRVNLTAQWFGITEVDIIIEMIENGEIPWLKQLPK
ncbi:hypothetical protein [Sphingobacterium sp. HSC-15S19]|uniref:hypothetical protein n=1 Tax=Sphingobacterium sp. HSC-15S19 TaxID=2910971 RepID=UPI003D1EA83D